MAGLPAQLRARLAGLGRRAAEFVFGLPGYRLSLVGRMPSSMASSLPDPWPGNGEQGAALIGGRFRFAGCEAPLNGNIWSASAMPAEWQDALHGFAWLRDLRAVGGDRARATARRLVAEWLELHGDWSLPAWRSDVMGMRLASWLAHYDTFFASGDEEFRRLLLASIARQLKHLHRALRLETTGAARIVALKGEILCLLCFGSGDRLARAVQMLDHEIEQQVLADGGHVSRNPEHLLSVLRDLLEIRAALVAGQQEIPEKLQQAIDRMGPMLRFLRHGDGRLGRFNGVRPLDSAMLDAVVQRAIPKGKPAARAPAMGYERLAAGRLTVVADSGAPAAAPWDFGAHAGTLSIEVTDRRQPLIVNCGASLSDEAKWRDAQRATAAHSTLVVNDRNSSALLPDGHVGRRRAVTDVKSQTADGELYVSMRHDGYLASDGVSHRRQLFLSVDGSDLRGEDTLTGRAGVPFALRFHLHPSIRASLLQSGQAALLKPPSGGGWHLRASAGMDLADSIYFEETPEPKRTIQIVIAGVTGEGETTIKWALRRD